MSDTDYHFAREDRTLRGQRIARQVAAHPEEIAVALANLDRWQTLGRVHPAPILAWRKRLLDAQQSPAAFDELIAFLSAPNHDSEPLKSCSPFVSRSRNSASTAIP